MFERVLYGKAGLAEASEGPEFLNQLIGNDKSQMRLDEGLARPQAIAVHQGRVFVANALGSAINVFDLPQRTFYKIGDLGEEGAGALRQPVGLSVSRSGHLFVADAAANAIVVFDPSGRFVRRIGGPAWFARLVNVTADPAEDRVYALDSGAAVARVRVFNALDGAHLFDFGSAGDGPGQFDVPIDLAVGAQGLLYVVDSGNSRVQVFDLQGRYVSTFGSAGRQPGQFARPREVATDAQGNVYVVDSTFANVQVFSAQGHFLFFVGARDQTEAQAHYLIPTGIAIDADGRLYVADQWYGKIEVFRPLGNRDNIAPE